MIERIALATLFVSLGRYFVDCYESFIIPYQSHHFPTGTYFWGTGAKKKTAGSQNEVNLKLLMCGHCATSNRIRTF